MRRWFVFLNAVLAGVCIGIGGTAFLSIDNKTVGALFFTIGLFVILTQGLNLFTGKVLYIFERGKAYVLDIPLIWLGNLAGTFAVGAAVRATRIAAIAEKAATICDAKLADGLLSIFILAIFCNILMFVAVDGYNSNPHEIGKYVAMFLGVAGFILCGFEHCIANMYYFTVAGAWSGKALLYLIVMTLGNAVGGVIFPLARMWKSRHERETTKV